jgi:hypothetical protein
MGPRSENGLDGGVHVFLPVRFYDFINAVPVLRGLSTSRHACCLKRDAEPKEGAPIFVVVHGTWSRGAAWTRRESNLMKELASKWPESGRYRFIWSATNGIRHRLVAADVLSEELLRLGKEYPRSKLVAIAHSHGGNVVAWASTKLDQPLAAAAYLNTPFIQALNSSSEFNVILRSILLIGGAAFLIPFARTVQDLLLRSRPDLETFAFFLGLGILALGLALLQGIVPSWLTAIRDRLIRVSTGARTITRELAAFVVGDEPNSVFGAVYLLQWLGRAIFMALLVVFLFLANTHFIAQSTVDTIGMRLAIGSLGAYVVYVLLVTGAYGFVQALLGLDATIAVAPAPVGRTDFVSVPWTPLDRSRHSSVHDSPVAIAAVTGWLQSVLAPPNASSAPPSDN